MRIGGRRSRAFLAAGVAAVAAAAIVFALARVDFNSPHQVGAVSFGLLGMSTTLAPFFLAWLVVRRAGGRAARWSFALVTALTIAAIALSVLGPLDAGVEFFFDYAVALAIPILFAAGCLAVHWWNQDVRQS